MVALVDSGCGHCRGRDARASVAFFAISMLAFISSAPVETVSTLRLTCSDAADTTPACADVRWRCCSSACGPTRALRRTGQRLRVLGDRRDDRGAHARDRAVQRVGQRAHPSVLVLSRRRVRVTCATASSTPTVSASGLVMPPEMLLAISAASSNRMAAATPKKT